MITKNIEGYFVKSDKTNQTVGGPYPTHAQAQKIERQVTFIDITKRRAFTNTRPTSYIQLVAQARANKK